MESKQVFCTLAARKRVPWEGRAASGGGVLNLLASPGLGFGRGGAPLLVGPRMVDGEPWEGLVKRPPDSLPLIDLRCFLG